MASHVKTIIFPTDFSEISVTALPWVLDMADKFSAEIHCVYVVEEPQIYSSLDMATVAVPTSGELMKSATARLEKFCKTHLNNSTHGYSQKTLLGHAATEIVNYSNEHKAAMIIMPTHGYSGVKHLLLGSTTEDVLRRAPCPVMSIRAS